MVLSQHEIYLLANLGVALISTVGEGDVWCNSSLTAGIIDCEVDNVWYLLLLLYIAVIQLLLLPSVKQHTSYKIRSHFHLFHYILQVPSDRMLYIVENNPLKWVQYACVRSTTKLDVVTPQSIVVGSLQHKVIHIRKAVITRMGNLRIERKNTDSSLTKASINLYTRVHS